MDKKYKDIHILQFNHEVCVMREIAEPITIYGNYIEFSYKENPIERQRILIPTDLLGVKIIID